MLQQQVLQGASRLPSDDSPIERVSKKTQTVKDTSILEDVLSRGIALDNVSEADSSVTYYVSGYIARSISRRRKCQSCKEMLIKNAEMPPIVDFAEDKSTLLELANRGGLAVPSDYCFAVSTLAVQVFDVLTSDNNAKKEVAAMQ